MGDTQHENFRSEEPRFPSATYQRVVIERDPEQDTWGYAVWYGGFPQTLPDFTGFNYPTAFDAWAVALGILHDPYGKAQYAEENAE